MFTRATIENNYSISNAFAVDYVKLLGNVYIYKLISNTWSYVYTISGSASENFGMSLYWYGTSLYSGAPQYLTSLGTFKQRCKTDYFLINYGYLQKQEGSN